MLYRSDGCDSPPAPSCGLLGGAGGARCRSFRKSFEAGHTVICKCRPMLRRDAVALYPRAHGVDRNAPCASHCIGGAGAFDDFRVCMHSSIVHYALEERKCLLHRQRRYADFMDTPGDRLKAARVAAGYSSAAEAAEAMGLANATYTQHENGIRGIPKDKAPIYARRFKVSEEWLLYGKGGKPSLLDGAEPTMPIPLLGDVPGGNWREAIRTSHHYIPAPQAGMPAAAYALKVRGDSMDKVAKDGATIVIDPTDFDLFEKRLFVVRNEDGEVTFKQYLERPARLVPCSKNPAHKPIPVTDKGYEIVGRVIKIILDPDQAALD